MYDEGLPDEVIQAGEWSVSGTGAATLTPAVNLPAGTVCRVTGETGPSPDALIDGSWRWDPAGPTISAAVTVQGPDESPVITVTNQAERVYSSMSLTKTYAGVAGAFAAGTTVSGTWSCTYQGQEVANGRWTVPASGGVARLFAADGTVLGPNGPILVPVSAQCSTVEDTLVDSALTDASYTWMPEVYTPANHTVTTTPDTVASVTVTNSTQRVLRPLDITKVIQAPDGVTVRTGLTFSGDFVCTHPGERDRTGVWQVQDTGSTSIQGVLVGSTCRITRENTPFDLPVAAEESYKWQPPVFSGTGVTLDRTTPAELTILNPVARQLTDLRITKKLTGDLAAVPAGQRFDLSYTCTAMNGDVVDGASTLAAGATWTTPTHIPVGARCSVTEGTLPTLTPRATWDPVEFAVTDILANPVTVTGQSAAFDIPAGQADLAVSHPVVTVTNTATRSPISWTVTKTADPPSGTTVKPGGTVTYRVTIQPQGPGVVENVVIQDDLSKVLPYATFGSATAGQGSAALAGTVLTWTVGRVSGNAPIVLTYTVTVKPDAWGATLTNVITPTGDLPPATCPAGPLGAAFTTGRSPALPAAVEPCWTTSHPVEPAWTLTKSSDPASGAVVRPGQVITYYLTARNLSKVTPVGPIKITDELTGVLPYADVVSIGPAPVGSTSRVGSTVVWDIPKLSGTAVVKIVVKVKPNAGGAIVDNRVSAQATPPPTPCPSCTTETKHPVSGTWSITKRADPPSGSTVKVGQQVTYTVTVTSHSTTTLTGVTVTDDLSGVLAYADPGTLQPDRGTTKVDGTTLTWTIGTLEPGAVATIRYSVTVRAGAEGQVLRNVVAGRGDTPPDQCLICSTRHPVEKRNVPGPGPITGSDVGQALGGSLLLMFGGTALILFGRRARFRRQTELPE